LSSLDRKFYKVVSAYPFIDKMKKCVECGKLIRKKDFRNENNWKESKLSGLCQECQDNSFGIA